MNPTSDVATAVCPDAAPDTTSEISDRDLLQIWRTLRRSTAGVDHRIGVAMAAVHLQAQVVEVLALLVDSPNQRLTMSRLATAFGLTTGGLTKLVDRMVADDLVHRQHCVTDRRVVFAVLTDRGDAAFARATPVYAAQLRAEFGHLTPARLAALHAETRRWSTVRPGPSTARCVPREGSDSDA